MTGPKLNEKSYVAGERSGTKATAKYVRSSASKARVVLDLIRGLDVMTADQVLQFTDRAIARDIRKVLASAVANAVNNDDQDAEELFVIACFADEGPTLRRFRPRARGRATRINKRTCHITVIVARMSDQQLEILQARQERAGGQGGRGRPTSSSASRRARVERSRRRAAEADNDEDIVDAEIATDDAVEADLETAVEADAQDAVDTTAELAADAELEAESTAADTADAEDDTPAADEAEAAEADEEKTDVTPAAEGSASDEAEAARGESEADAEPAVDTKDNS